MEAFNCPNCQAPLDGEIIDGRIRCSYCNGIIVVGGKGRDVKDENTGLVIATCECPKNYSLNGLLNENLQSSIYPLTTVVWCESANKKTKFLWESGKAFQQILRHMLIRHIEGQMESNYTIPMQTFKTTEEYLDLISLEYANGKDIELIKTIDLVPTNFIDKNIPRVIQVEMELQATGFSYGVDTNYDKGLSKLYKVGDKYLLLSTNVLGIKWHVNAPMLMPDMNQITDFGKKIGEKLKGTSFKKMFDYGMQGGLLNAKKQEKVEEVVEEKKDVGVDEENEMRIPSKGKAVSFTNWWVPAVYSIWSDELPDEKMLKDFSMFCSSVCESDTILQRRYQISSQYIQNMYVAMQQEQAMVNNYVANAQADIHRRQAQISQSIQQRSNIINSTYQNRVASQDRMRKQTSEAIRGVDTYSTSNGPVEFKTGAKRVVQKNNDPKNMVEIGYLDTVPQGWTEIFKE